MSRRAVAETGPLVAILGAREADHARCRAAIADFRPPLLTCWPALTEAAWLLRNDPGGIRALAGMIRCGALALAPLDGAAIDRIVAFMERYASNGAQLADAALMYIAESEGIDAVFTLDRRDFSVYRTTDGRALDLFPQD